MVSIVCDSRLTVRVRRLHRCLLATLTASRRFTLTHCSNMTAKDRTPASPSLFTAYRQVTYCITGWPLFLESHGI